MAIGAGLTGGLVGSYLRFSPGLPDIPDLRSYRPKTVSTFYAEDGTVIGIFYTQKRFPIPLDSMPPHVVGAFLAAEDARFFSHPGLDWIGMVRAVIANLRKSDFAQGASTITQQVTRNFMLHREKKLARKIREAILAFRLEKTLTKREILGLYLNEIYFGKGAYGVEAAGRTFFGKTTDRLSVAEAALLAGVVSSPSRFSPHRNLEACLKRRDSVLANMLRYGFISQEQHRLAVSEVPGFREDLPNTYQRAPYFAEAVRQYIAEKYGENRLYNEGLQVWTTCDLRLQDQGSHALIKGAKAWQERQQRPPGLVRRLKPAEAKLFRDGPDKETLQAGDLVEALVVANDTPKRSNKKKTESEVQDCTLALAGGAVFKMKLDSRILYRPNDVLQFRVSQTDGTRINLEIDSMPPIEGAVVCIENHTGYVRALVGGLDFERSRFNRAVQAMRQPGSAFKPFVYATALELGYYGPSTVVVDEPIAVEISAQEPEWIPMNADGNFMGPITLRQALAQSRNVAAVKLIMDVGVEPTIDLASAMGIGSRLGKNLSLSLGSSEVTPLELTAAYTVFPNMGIRQQPVLIKKVVDRFGRVLEDNTRAPLDIVAAADKPLRVVPPMDTDQADLQTYPGDDIPQAVDTAGASAPDADFGTEDDSSDDSGVEAALMAAFPSIPVSRGLDALPVLSPQTAYLMVSMLRDTCVSGTGASAAKLGRKDISGKTGTTDDCTDAWFVGFNPGYTTGVWVGYDTKVSLGKNEFGNIAALPIWMEFMKEALKNSPAGGYPVPPGIVFWELGKPPQQTPLQDLLQAGADLPALPELKPVCPVDAETMAFSSGWDPFTGWPVPASSTMYLSGAGPAGSVRVLTSKGETLGHGYLGSDEKGRTTLWVDQSHSFGTFRQHGLTRDSRAHSMHGRSPYSPYYGNGQAPAPQMVMPRGGRFSGRPRRVPPPFDQDSQLQ